jgi:hypothetical protein
MTNEKNKKNKTSFMGKLHFVSAALCQRIAGFLLVVFAVGIGLSLWDGRVWGAVADRSGRKGSPVCAAGSFPSGLI